MFDIIGYKSKINKLNNAKRDLTDDSWSVNAINSRINDVIDDLYSFIGSGASQSAYRLESYKETNQYNDYNLSEAREYIQYEINYLQNKINEG